MSKQDTCIFYEYFGDYGMNICNHPSRLGHSSIDNGDCRKCKLHQSHSSGIKKCPFCGSKAKISHCLGEFNVFCTKCPAEMKDRNVDKVIENWNRRTVV